MTKLYIKYFFVISFLCVANKVSAQTYFQDSIIISKIYNEALTKGKSYGMLQYLCNNIGHRLSGSNTAQIAVNWTQTSMSKMGFDQVYLQEVMVPRWIRGEKETAFIEEKGIVNQVSICALGGSVGTGGGGIKAEMIEVKSFEELKARNVDSVRGRIVFFNSAMDASELNPFDAYSKAVYQRVNGAIEAAKLGAIGVIVRSMNVSIDDYPHTGSVRYSPTVNRIPAAAISTLDAEFLAKRLKNNPCLKFQFRLSCDTLPDVKSYNVVAEIKGYEVPEEIILVGGHLDSWDLGTGAHDDGAGCVQSMEALRLFKALGIRPKRTVRAVLFMNEENGLRGGLEYARQAKLLNEKHIAAIESDAGGFTPRGFGIDADAATITKIEAWKELLAPYGLSEIGKGHGGADISPLKEQNTALLGLSPDPQRYFDFHHSALDRFEGVNKRELELGAASMAAMLYLLSTYGL